MSNQFVQASVQPLRTILEIISDFPTWMKTLLLVAVDLSVATVSVYGAMFIRFDGAFRWDYMASGHEWVMLAYLPISIGIFYLFGLYHQIWEFASLRELALVAGASFTTGLIYSALTYFPAEINHSRGIMILNGLLLLVFLGASRLSVRVARMLVYRTRVASKMGASRTRLLVAGAGEAGRLIVREIRKHPHLGRVVGVLDDAPDKQGRRVGGYKVRGTLEELEQVAKDRDAESLIIALPSTAYQEIRDLTFRAKQIGLETMTIPDLRPILQGDISPSMIKEVEMKDLLPREPLDVDLDEIKQELEDQVVLVTGAGGSIGSEICRQVALCDIEQLVMVDHSEGNLFKITRELSESFPDQDFDSIVADISDRTRVKKVFDQVQPDFVLHAAANKHVPMMEENPCAALRTNVYGTLYCARASIDVGVDTFLLISTDKAVNPTSVMGATKRVAEKLVQILDYKHRDQNGSSEHTNLMAVRFGNVLGSSGSVVETFEEQIENGGPVTVTDPKMKRYFMTVSEAVHLVLKSISQSTGGEIFILDMGEPIQILELAKDMIRLSGFEPERDIPIEIVGPRPGEKFCEELFYPEEKQKAYVQDRIYRYDYMDSIEFDLLGEVEKFESTLFREGISPESTRGLLRKWVEFQESVGQENTTDEEKKELTENTSKV